MSFLLPKDSTRQEQGLSEHKYTNERVDFNPRSWLSRYRKTSIPYLLKMLLFYHGIGLLLMTAGTFAVGQLVPGYEEPNIIHSLLSVIFAGPTEETLFFGIPFYLFGSHYAVLITGAIWATFHVFNTNTLDINHLAFGNWLFVVPSLFFSLRTWISGKGWFAIVTHSAWNGIFYMIGCSSGEARCMLLDTGQEMTSLASGVVVAAALVAITYMLYKRHEEKERKRLAA
jgi:hypothetical protein